MNIGLHGIIATTAPGPFLLRLKMATILPQYERLVGDDMDNDPAWPHIDEDDEEAKINTYPPGPSTGTGSSRVTFIFVPRWPLKGKQESVLGVMGKNKMVCVR